ncbi:MAG: putative immunity protein [Rhizobiaceae bacterium]
MTDAMPYSITMEDLKAANPCQDRLAAATAAIKTWPATAEDAFAAGLDVGDVLWIGFRVARERRDAGLRRRLLHAVADIAEQALPIFEKHAPNDARPREAIDAVRQLADGTDTSACAARAADGAARTAADAVYTAANAAAYAAYAATATAADADAAAYAASRAAAYAASRAAAHAAAKAEQKRIISAWLSDTPPARAKKEGL